MAPFDSFLNRYQVARLHTLCCGCINNRLGSILACIIWTGFSFYFAVMAFMQSSPFFSYIHEAPLIIFGVVNLIFGLVSLIMLILMFVLPRYAQVRSLAYVIGFFVIAVLADTLVNFVLFLIHSDDFQSRCIEDAQKRVQHDFQQNNQGSLQNATLNIASDYYNCNRLYQDEVKWSLSCLVVMYITYIHWTLVVASYVGSSFYFIPPPPPPVVPPEAVPVEMVGNLPPSRTKRSELKNMRPPQSLKRVFARDRQWQHERWDKIQRAAGASPSLPSTSDPEKALSHDYLQR
ncbi:uncharacterized protein BYT42DRAFT_553104 [Radiomyces spectabilis]|uniref:uncharacterized protein n=1 Tax=Radiomyces spectabilis TaxID=64574 RepID=UPI002220236E|nr:uncharacterized protein BYT42DRAFT_553104 [Radiomyces spectabilis]KAI8394029.1 hypothetical protein BYT42DRAFT_553104 [Radiomyces spectabilis]